jgi:site-specific recombinase XerD
MEDDVKPAIRRSPLNLGPRDAVPRIVSRTGEQAIRRFVEFFAATIRNRNTRLAYAEAVKQFFAWCDSRAFRCLDQIEPIVVAAYIEQHAGSKPTVKQHLAAIRMLFDWLVIGQIVPMSPAASVRGPTHVVKRGKTPVLSADQARELLDSIDASTVLGLRDRALIGLMVYTFARVSAAISMTTADYFAEGKRWWIRLYEKGGKEHVVPAHHSLEAYVDAYLQGAGLSVARDSSPLFRTIDREGRLTDRQMTRSDALRMIKRRVRAIGLPASTCCHTFRATGITAYLDNGGTIDDVQSYCLPSPAVNGLRVSCEIQ